jgi:hypothetical protein
MAPIEVVQMLDELYQEFGKSVALVGCFPGASDDRITVAVHHLVSCSGRRGLAPVYVAALYRLSEGGLPVRGRIVPPPFVVSPSAA